MRPSHGIGFDGSPHHGACSASGRAFDPVCRYDTVDHVGENRHPRSTLDADRHSDRLDPSSIDLSLERSINTSKPRRTAKTRNREPPGTRHLAE